MRSISLPCVNHSPTPDIRWWEEGSESESVRKRIFWVHHLTSAMSGASASRKSYLCLQGHNRWDNPRSFKPLCTKWRFCSLKKHSCLKSCPPSGKSVFERPIDLITVGNPNNVNLKREVFDRVIIILKKISWSSIMTLRNLFPLNLRFHSFWVKYIKSPMRYQLLDHL